MASDMGKVEDVAELLSELNGSQREDALCALMAMPGLLPVVAEAFRMETNPDRRWAAIHCLGQYRDDAALPTLSAALRDPDDRVWKEALDGLVTLGGSMAVRTLQDASIFLAENARDPRVKRAWIDEAIEQIREPVDPD